MVLKGLEKGLIWLNKALKGFKKAFYPGSIYYGLHFPGFLPPKKLRQKINLRQNTVCWKQKIYQSPNNFTPGLMVAFRISDIV